MLEGLSDQQVERLLRVAKTARGLRPFFGNVKGMIALREEAARRGIYRTKDEADRMVERVCVRFKDDAR